MCIDILQPFFHIIKMKQNKKGKKLILTLTMVTQQQASTFTHSEIIWFLNLSDNLLFLKTERNTVRKN